ncbi:MAG TPA: UvrD-helicase domain-containing protein, partial [Polyangiaceae bacterium]|nr:UvrD-helicase domain-containing protein [Polyangiaceae bacterium]
MERQQFSATAPLTQQPVLVEASAGTGKTYGITNLVLRLVAEKAITVDRILVVTFTDAATSELRDRVRKRLVGVRDLLLRVSA